MRDEFAIVKMRDNASHVWELKSERDGSGYALCGKWPRLSDRVNILEWEPGADFGEHAADCRSCVANARERGLLR